MAFIIIFKGLIDFLKLNLEKFKHFLKIILI